MTGADLFLISSAVWGGVIVTAALIAFGVEKSRAKKRHAKRGHLQMGIRAQQDPSFPLAHRTDLPEHERKITAEAYAMLQAGKKAAIEGRVTKLDLADLADEDE